MKPQQNLPQSKLLGGAREVKAQCPQKFAWECDDEMWVMGPIGDTLLKKLRDPDAEVGRRVDWLKGTKGVAASWRT